MTEDEREERARACIDRLTTMAKFTRNKPPEPERLAAYAQRLAGLPPALFERVIGRLEERCEFFPSLSEVLAEVYRSLLIDGVVEDPEHAWKRLLREVGRWHPVTRPEVAYSNPVTATIVRLLGGPSTIHAALDAKEAVGLSIMQREFLKLYPIEAMSREQLSFAFHHHAWADPPPSSVVEVPTGQSVPRPIAAALAVYDHDRLPSGQHVYRLPPGGRKELASG